MRIIAIWSCGYPIGLFREPLALCECMMGAEMNSAGRGELERVPHITLAAPCCGGLSAGLKRIPSNSGARLSLERWSIFLLFQDQPNAGSSWEPFKINTPNKSKRRRVWKFCWVIKGETSIKSPYINFMSWVVGDFFQTQKGAMTLIVGNTFKLALSILRRPEREAEKNPD